MVVFGGLFASLFALHLKHRYYYNSNITNPILSYYWGVGNVRFMIKQGLN